MKYNVRIEDRPFDINLPNVKIIPRDRTAIITFIDDNDNESEPREYGVIDNAELNQIIASSPNINLDYCYIGLLSFTDFIKKSFGNFSASHAFFHYPVNFGGATFTGKADFTNSIFADTALFHLGALFNDDADFCGTVFDGETFFSSTFNGNVNFLCAKFNNKVSFSQTTFIKTARFDRSIFYFDAGFRNTFFGNETYFENAIFYKTADFILAVFTGNVVFMGTTFNGRLDFGSATFFRNAILNVVFGDSTDFVIFINSTFNQELHFSCNGNPLCLITFQDAKFLSLAVISIQQNNTLVLDSCTIDKILDLRKSKVDKLSFKGTRNLGCIYVNFQQDNIKAAILNYAGNKNELTHVDWASQFCMLKENFRSLGQYDDEDVAYVAYRREIAKSIRSMENEKCKLRRTIKKTFYMPVAAIKWVFLDLIGEYGTNPFRIVFTLVGIIALFGLFFWWIDGVDVSKIPFGTSYPTLTFWYFSAITAFTVGYGDLSPISIWAACLSSIEAFLGVFLMSYFVVAISRKIIR